MGFSKSMKIVLLAALPQEYQELRRKVGPWRLLGRKPVRRILWLHPDNDILVVETGMGEQSIQKALRMLSTTVFPDLLISIGFAGSIHKDLDVGQVALGEGFSAMDSGSKSLQSIRYDLEPSKDLIDFCSSNGIMRAQVITTNQPERKCTLLSEFINRPSVLDMESYYVARYAFAEQIPFLCFRAISDGPNDEIDFDLRSITDAQGRVRAYKAVLAILKKPQLTRVFHSSWQRSRKAARSLAGALMAFADSLPALKTPQLLVESSGRRGWDAEGSVCEVPARAN